MLGPPDWLKMKNANAPAVKREAEGESIVEHFAGVEDYQVALATFELWAKVGDGVKG